MAELDQPRLVEETDYSSSASGMLLHIANHMLLKVAGLAIPGGKQGN